MTTTQTAPRTRSANRRGSGAGVLGAAAFAADTAEDLLLGTVRDVHGAIAGRVMNLTDKVTGGASVPHRMHDGISHLVYAGLGAGIRATATGLRKADEAGIGGRLEESAEGRFVVSAVNGLIGDRLAEEHSDLAIEAAVRFHGEDIDPGSPEELAAAFPTASDALVIFLHGLGESEAVWNLRRDETGGNYGQRLADEHGWTPVSLRVNTGLPIAENGVALASLLDQLVNAWPTDVRRIALVGHSMGGLIFRAACAVSTDAESPWNNLVTDVVCLGTPHLGAPLERVVNHGARALGALPEVAPFARILEYRSVGILDLRGGLAPDVQNLPHARYHLVAATLTKSPRHPVAESLGDLLVPYSSALGRTRRGVDMFPKANVLHVPGANHFDLLNHDDVYAALRLWLHDDGVQEPDERTA